MKILSLECSTARAGVAVWEDGKIRFAKEFESPRGRGGILFAVAAEAIAIVGRPDRLVVGLGPGSYNGLRAAIALAQGLAIGGASQADEPIPLAGVLSPLALDKGERDYVFVGDARGGAIHFTRVQNGAAIDGPRLVAREDWPGMRADLPCPVYSADGIEGTEAAFPSASRIAERGLEMESHGGEIEPVYLKPPHITIPRAGRTIKE